LVGIHIRRADYRLPGRNANIAPTKWYLEWLDKNWSNIDNPILFVASDEIDSVVKDFERFRPCRFIKDSDFLFDFYALCHCDVLLISNSTFSFAAAMLNGGADVGILPFGKRFYRPDFNNCEMASFDPWNAEPLLKP
jgi:hypothetical protein